MPEQGGTTWFLLLPLIKPGGMVDEFLDGGLGVVDHKFVPLFSHVIPASEPG